MKNNGAVIRAFRFDLCYFMQYLPQYILIITLFTFITAYSNTMSPIYMVTLFMSIIPLVMTIQRYTLFFSQTVGFGITRRSFILGGLIIKPVYMLFAVCGLLIAGIFDKSGFEPIPMAMLGALLALIGACFGDLLGTLMLKLGKVGLVIYMILYGGTFGVIGGISGYLASEGKVIVIDMGAVPIIIAAALVMLAVGTFVPWLLIRRVEVR